MSVDAHATLSDTDRNFLLDEAADAIADRLLDRRTTSHSAPKSARLGHPGASFVTLRRDERLLGCIGTLEAAQPLYLDVRHNAHAAAFEDPRLPPVSLDDYLVMSIKVSVLSPLEPMSIANHDELLATLEPGADGLLVTAGSRRGTFLPSVWEQVPNRHDFLEALWQKAGLHRGAWPHDIRFWRYHTDEFADDGPRPLPR